MFTLDAIFTLQNAEPVPAKNKIRVEALLNLEIEILVVFISGGLWCNLEILCFDEADKNLIQHHNIADETRK